MSSLVSRFGGRSPSLRSASPLSDDQIRSVAPSIFAQGAHDSRSQRYTYIPTVDVLAGLRREGFSPFAVAQTRTKASDRREYTKHMLRLRKEGQLNAEGSANEIILINSHDGSSRYQLLGGVFRFVCLNGLVVGDEPFDLRVPHKGEVVHNVIDAAFTLVDNFGKIDEQRQGMQALELSRPQQVAFARSALALRYDEGTAPYEPEALLVTRRSEDEARDLWTSFNRVQENMTAGGITGRTAANRRIVSRPIAAIDNSVKINRALWVLAEEMRKLAA